MGFDLKVTCILEIEFTLKDGKRREFNRSIEDVRGIEGDGHVRTSIFEDREEPGHILWASYWSDRGKLENYLRSESLGVLFGALRVLAIMERCRLVSESAGAAGTEFFEVDRLPHPWTAEKADL